LMPIRWPEPFGLVMAEALACGTPVIAFPEGSAPELVRDGETGFLVADEHAMAAAVGRLGEIDPAACRRDCEEVPSLPGAAPPRARWRSLARDSSPSSSSGPSAACRASPRAALGPPSCWQPRHSGACCRASCHCCHSCRPCCYGCGWIVCFCWSPSVLLICFPSWWARKHPAGNRGPSNGRWRGARSQHRDLSWRQQRLEALPPAAASVNRWPSSSDWRNARLRARRAGRPTEMLTTSKLPCARGAGCPAEPSSTLRAGSVSTPRIERFEAVLVQPICQQRAPARRSLPRRADYSREPRSLPCTVSP